MLQDFYSQNVSVECTCLTRSETFKEQSIALGLQMLDIKVCLGETLGFSFTCHLNDKHGMALKGGMHILFYRSKMFDVFISVTAEGG